MDLSRMARHLFTTEWGVRRAFPRATLDAIERAIAHGEQTHGGQIRFAVEDALELHELVRGMSARDRAVEVFSRLRVWDTQHNNGVLIYLLFAERNAEIVADRGISALVGQEEWEAVCRAMGQRFARHEFEAGVLAGISAVGALLRRHFPARGERELPDKPVVL